MRGGAGRLGRRLLAGTMASGRPRSRWFPTPKGSERGKAGTQGPWVVATGGVHAPWAASAFVPERTSVHALPGPGAGQGDVSLSLVTLNS